MTCDIQTQDFAGPRPLAVVRRRAGVQDLPRVIPQSCGLVWNALRSLQVKGAGRHVAVYWDDQINLEVGVELDAPFAASGEGAGEVVGSALPAGTTASAIYFGPYGRLPLAHQAIRDWCAKHGYAPAGPRWEVYGHWVDAWNADPGLIRTDVFYLLTPGGPSAG